MRSASLLLFVALASCPVKPAPATLPGPLAAPARPAPATTKAQGRCAMCGMDVSLQPDWAGSIELADGAIHGTCSVRCTLAIAMNPQKLLGVDASQVRSVRVPDYLHPGTRLEATSATFVVDSDVRGPMGVELVPAGNEADLQVVVSRHGGRMLRHSEVTPALLMALKEHGKSSR